MEEIYKLREEKQQILADKAEMEGVKQSIFNMKAFLNSQTVEMEEKDTNGDIGVVNISNIGQLEVDYSSLDKLDEEER